MKHITLKEMLNRLVEEIIRPTGKRPRFFWEDNNGKRNEINEVDLMEDKFYTSYYDLVKYESELNESHIYIAEQEDGQN